MNSKTSCIKPQFRSEVQINSKFAYQSFLKRGCRIIPKLTVKMSWKERESLDLKISKKVKVFKVFKKVRYVRALDLTELNLSDSSLAKYMAKRASNTARLSVYDERTVRNLYQGTVNLWPKHLKHLRTIFYSISGSKLETFFGMDNIRLPKRIKLMTSSLKYLRKLENFRALNKSDRYSHYLDDLWRIEAYPTSLKKLSLCNANHNSGNTLENLSLARFKQLRGLEITLNNASSERLMKPVTNFFLQGTQLESLSINFLKGFRIDVPVFQAIRALKKLKKVKFELSAEQHKGNLRVLESLEKLSLKDVNLKIVLSSDEDISFVTDLLLQQIDSLEALKLQLLSPDTFESSKSMNELVKAIDNLPQLTSLYLSAKSSRPSYNSSVQRFVIFNDADKPVNFHNQKAKILSEKDLHFQKLLSKKIPLKKFRLRLQQDAISKEEFFGILESLKTVAPTLRKLEINIGRCQIEEEAERAEILKFIKSLEKIRSLNLLSLYIPSQKFLSEVTQAIYTLNFLESLSLKDSFEDSLKKKNRSVKKIEKIILKHGLRKFNWITSLLFYSDDSGISSDDSRFSRNSSFYRIDLAKVKKKNPFLKSYPSYAIYKNTHDRWF